MLKLDHSDTVLIVKPVGSTASDALKSKHNINRLASFHQENDISTLSEQLDATTRECTPYMPPPAEIELHLKFSPIPTDPARGFVFGTNVERCDIALRNETAQGVSREHFSVDFNWESGILRLNNISRYGTGIRAPSVSGGHQHLKHNNRHMLHPAEQTRVSVGTLQFDLSFPIRTKEESLSYQRNWEAFRTQCMQAVPMADTLVVDLAPGPTPFTVRRESDDHSYCLHDEIGRGGYGTVCKATRTPDGALFAAKQFAKHSKWEKRARAEIALFQKITHEHIVNFVDVINDDEGLILIMEYIPLGNLKGVHDQSALSLEEIQTALYQTLQALEYLHNEKKITHRDIKPENILVRSRTTEFSIKLCDFGVATDKEAQKTKTFCGTARYLAPESLSRKYSSSVDIWAMGVVTLELIDGLPRGPENFEDLPIWCRMIGCRVSNRAVDMPVVSLLKRMLVLRPVSRPSAQDCLRDPSMKIFAQNLRTQAACLLRPATRKLKELSQPSVGPRKRAWSSLCKEEAGVMDEFVPSVQTVFF